MPTAVASRRDRVALELYATEKTYVKNLRLLNDLFVVPLENRLAEGSPVLTATELQSCFGGIGHVRNRIAI